MTTIPLGKFYRDADGNRLSGAVNALVFGFWYIAFSRVTYAKFSKSTYWFEERHHTKENEKPLERLPHKLPEVK